MTLRHALVRLVTPLVWRVPGHGARKLQGFARAEQASRIDLLQAAQRTASLPRRALYLRHALDETRHAGMFWRRSTELRLEARRAPFTPPVADTEDLFERLGERRFLAFVHRGERRGREQFTLYARHFGARGDARTAALFEAILIDERRHESYTRELLVELAGGERAARAELRWAALWEAWRMWRRAGRALAAAIYTLAMTAIYLVTGPIAALGLRALRRRSRWQLAAPLARPPADAVPPVLAEPAAQPAQPAQPAPTAAQPAPTAAQPAPTAAQPAPTAAQPAPTAAQPAPTAAQPAPTAAQPAPTAAQPAPTAALPTARPRPEAAR
jgi:rubrerythrin